MSLPAAYAPPSWAELPTKVQLTSSGLEPVLPDRNAPPHSAAEFPMKMQL